VTELAVFESDMCKKNWMTSHTDDILCSAARFPHLLATGTYNGELILWRLETGQPFKKYQVTDVGDINLILSWKITDITSGNQKSIDLIGTRER